MKCKKILALAFSALMAVGMLAGCGSSGGSSSDLSRSSVNSALTSVGSKVRASSETELNAAMGRAYDEMEQGRIAKSNDALHAYLVADRGYNSSGIKGGPLL